MQSAKEKVVISIPECKQELAIWLQLEMLQTGVRKENSQTIVPELQYKKNDQDQQT